jgi:predicted AlkP superfamily phosphohydrolase/phosphomutase
MKNKQRVLIIGIDGGTFDIIQPMVQRGELPILASLMEKGAWGELESSIPPDTGPAWVSMMTGVNPGKHGIYFFLDNLHYNLKSGRPLGSADIKFPPLWSILSSYGKNVIFVNVPFTYPPTEVKGIIISGMFVPNNAEVLSYPQDIYTELKVKLSGYEIDDWSPEIICPDRSKINLHYDKVVEYVSLVTEKRKKATLMLLENNDWDFAMVVFTSMDRFQHIFWRFIDTSGNESNLGHLNKFRKVIHDGYQQLDKAIGEIIEKAGKDTTVIIVSDHGFGPLKKLFFVNKWLEEIGLLKIKRGLSQKKFKPGLTNLYRVLTKIIHTSKLPGWTKRIPIPIPKIQFRDRSELINWQKTKAYGNQSGININLRGREPHGVVEPGKEYEDLLTFIQEQFYRLEDESEPQKSKIADWILRKEEIYNGPYVEEAADLYFSLKNRSYLQNANINVNSKFGSPFLGSGMHRMNGIFIMYGPLCCKCDSIKPRMIDVAPTVLYLMGLPILEEMDGRVLEEIIDPVYLKSYPVKVVSSVEYSAKGTVYSAEAEEKIKESLKGLGYLS